LSSAKEKWGKERSEEIEKKRKEVKGDPHIKGRGSQIFKSRSRSTVKRSLNETWKDCRRL
jgi:flagellar biosynthesis protein FlhB